MKKFDVITIGELNVDLIFNNLSSLPEIGKEIRAGRFSFELGSSSAIFANNLSRMGSNVAFVGKTGTDIFGDFILQKLRQAGVDTNMVSRDGMHATGATVVLNFDENREMITHPGAMEQLRAEDIHTNIFSTAKHLHISSYFLQTNLQKQVSKLFGEAKKAGLTTSFDPQWDPSEKWAINLEEILPVVDVFLPNKVELINLTGQKNMDRAIAHIEKITNILVVKMGSEGSISLFKGRSLFKPAYLNGKVADAIGAGDSFNAGFIHKFVRRSSIETCQEFGNLM